MLAKPETLKPKFGSTPKTRKPRTLLALGVGLLLMVPSIGWGISDRGVQEHGKVAPRSIDSSYMGTWGDNRNSGSCLVRGLIRKRFVAMGQYLSWTEPGSPPISSIQPVGSTEAPNGLIISTSGRGGGTSSVVAHNLEGKLVWKTEEWMGPEDNGITIAPSAYINPPMVDNEGSLYVSDNSGIWKLNQDTGDVIWFSRFLDYSDNRIGTCDLRLIPEGFVGAVTAAGWHIWVDKDTGNPVVVKEPDPFSAPDCGRRFFDFASAGEMDRSGELDDIGCLAYNANTTTPQPNTTAVAPAIPGRERKHTRYLFTYAGPPGSPEKARLMAYDFVLKDGVWSVQKAWERLIATDTGASPTITPDYTRVAAPDGLGRLNLTNLETGEPLPEPPDLKFFDFGSPCNTIDGWYCTYDPIRCVTAEGKPAVQMNYEPARAIAEQILPRKDSIPFLWDGRPDVNMLGGTVYDPIQFNVTVQAGYRSLLGTVIGKTIDLGAITPHFMFPFNYDWRTGEPIPGQNIDPSLVLPTISEGCAYVSTTGRYIVQKAELSTLVYYYLLQNHIFPFPIPGLPEVYIPDDYRVGQPVGGFAIYEPESYRDGAQKQAELGVFLVEWASDNLCESGCGLEEAAARLGYAAWNLDHAFNKQLKEALDRGEIQSGLYKKVLDWGKRAASDCRKARESLLKDQPKDPTDADIDVAKSHSDKSLESLHKITGAL